MDRGGLHLNDLLPSSVCNAAAICVSFNGLSPKTKQRFPQLAEETGIDGASCLVISMSSDVNGTIAEESPEICEEGGSGLLFPLVSSEHTWNRGFRTFLYFVFLVWCFLGVAIVSDIFMEAIERVTSKRKRKFNTANRKFVTVRVWNPTVANLTLMALGSSAPEILLSIIELLGNEVFAGELGPSTIVGSAAFNLFIISAVFPATFVSLGEVAK
eukprot:Skav212097  [mRNA]  locus=scaffold1725:9741:15690:- [translate_table: standard]